MNLIFNNKVLALTKRLMSNVVSLPFNLFETFGTEYGLFIPITASGRQFVRWVRKGMKDKLPPEVEITSYLLHISNDGEVCVVSADLQKDSIVFTSYMTEVFTMISPSRDISEAFSHLIRNCKTINEAITIVDNGNSEGLYDPYIVFVSDWVEYAKEKGYTKNFYYTSFSPL